MWFNAWRYEGKEEIQAALIHAILRELEKDKSLVQDMRETFERLKKGASDVALALLWDRERQLDDLLQIVAQRH